MSCWFSCFAYFNFQLIFGISYKTSQCLARRYPWFTTRTHDGLAHWGRCTVHTCCAQSWILSWSWFQVIYLWAARSAAGSECCSFILKFVILDIDGNRFSHFYCPNLSSGEPLASTLASYGTLGRSVGTWGNKQGHFGVQALIFSISGRFYVHILKVVRVPWAKKIYVS